MFSFWMQQGAFQVEAFQVVFLHQVFLLTTYTPKIHYAISRRNTVRLDHLCSIWGIFSYNVNLFNLSFGFLFSGFELEYKAT